MLVKIIYLHECIRHTFSEKNRQSRQPICVSFILWREVGNPGTVLTFFEIPMSAPTHRGTNSISGTSLRVADDKSLSYWKERFEEFGVEHSDITERAGHQVLTFERSRRTTFNTCVR